MVTVAHDLIPLRHPLLYLDPNPDYYRWYRQQLRLLHQSDAILCVSQATANDVIVFLGVLPDRVHAVGSAPPHLHSNREASSDLRGLDFKKDFRKLLYVYQQDYRKRADILVDAAAALVRRHKDVCLHLVTNQEEAERIGQYIAARGIPPEQVLIQTGLSDAELVEAYASAWFTVIPSIDEGFGLPAVESIVQGTPVLASNVGGIPEAIGTADALFEPGDVDGLIALLYRAIENPAWRNDLYDRQWNHVASQKWDVVGQKAFSVISEVASLDSPIATERPKINVSLPRLEVSDPNMAADGRTGFVGYMKELLCLLDARFDVQVKAPGWHLGGIIEELGTDSSGTSNQDDVHSLHQIYMNPRSLHEQLNEIMLGSVGNIIELHFASIDCERLAYEVAKTTADSAEPISAVAMEDEIKADMRIDLQTAIAASDGIIVHDEIIAAILEKSGACKREQEIVAFPYPSFSNSNEAKPPTVERSILLAEFGPIPGLGRFIVKALEASGLDSEGVIRIDGSNYYWNNCTTIDRLKLWTRPLPSIRTLSRIANHALAVVFVDDGKHEEIIREVEHRSSRPKIVVKKDASLDAIWMELQKLFQSINEQMELTESVVKGRGLQSELVGKIGYDGVNRSWKSILEHYDRLLDRKGKDGKIETEGSQL
jgi:hypothetical protein